MVQQVLSLLDVVTAGSLLKLVRALIAPVSAAKSSKRQADDAEDMDVDGSEPAGSQAAPTSSAASAECAVVINNLADLFQHFGYRDQPDIVRSVIETLPQITRQCTAGWSKPSASCQHSCLQCQALQCPVALVISC